MYLEERADSWVYEEIRGFMKNRVWKQIRGLDYIVSP